MTTPRTVAELRPRTFDRAAREVEAIAATGALVRRGAWHERLDVTGADLSQLIGAPLLDTHNEGSIAAQLGHVVAARIEGGRLLVRLRLNARAEAYLDEIAEGALRHVSVGYSVERWSEERRAPGGDTIRTARAWTPREISLVIRPADPGAILRSGSLDPEDITLPPEAPQAEAPPSAPETASELAPRPLEEMHRRQAATPLRAGGGGSADDPATLVTRMGEALFVRSHPGHQLSEAARPWAGSSTVDLARELLRRNGEAVMSLTPATLITRALHSTSDFPAVIGDAVNRSLREAYGDVPSAIERLARQASARDFRPRRITGIGDFPALERVGEHGEFTSGTLAEGEEAYGLATFGRILGITRQALVNDDLGAFTDLSGRIGRAARAFVAGQLVARLEANPVMGDGLAVFHAGHGNIGAATALAEAGLSAARLALRRQRGLGGELVDVAPAHLLVPPELETTAEKLLATINPATSAEAAVFAGKLDLVVDPRLTSPTRWYVTADPARVPCLEYAYLEGAPGPQIETRAGFEIDGLQVKVRLDFGAGWIDHRGWWSSGHA